MRRGKNYPLFSSGMYGFGAGFNDGPPRRCWCRTSFNYGGTPFIMNTGTNYSDEAEYDIISHGIASLFYNFPLPGFLVGLSLVLDSTTSRVYTFYFECEDLVSNRLQMTWEPPQSGWAWPSAGVFPGPFNTPVQDAPYTDVGPTRFGVANYGHFPPPWPA